MGAKLITDEGKNELLELGFKREEAGGAFKYLALGKANSTAAQNGSSKFSEASGYERAVVTASDAQNKSITLTATFDEENLNTSEGETIKEIGLCNDTSTDATFFMFSEVPPITKTGDISLEYTIIISID